MSSVARIVAGGQHPWKSDILRWAILEALAQFGDKFGDTEIYGLWHDTDAPWLHIEEIDSVKWVDGNKFPPYVSTAIQLLSPLQHKVRERLNAPRPCWWLRGPQTDVTIAWFDKNKRFKDLLNEMIDRANNWYRRLAELAGYNFKEIPHPSKSESVLDWIKSLAENMGISGVYITTTLDLLKEYQGQIQEIAPHWGKWWVVDLETLTRSPWDGGKLPKSAILVAKAETFVHLLKRLDFFLYATHIPYIKEVYDVDGQPFYRRVLLQISDDDKNRLVEVFGSDAIPPPDTLSCLALGYRVDADVELKEGEFVRVSFRRPS